MSGESRPPLQPLIDRFVKQVGGELITDLIDTRNPPWNADYFFREQNVIVELKALETGTSGYAGRRHIHLAAPRRGNPQSQLPGGPDGLPKVVVQVAKLARPNATLLTTTGFHSHARQHPRFRVLRIGERMLQEPMMEKLTAMRLSTLSAARKRVDGAAFASTMILSIVETAALEACCRRAIDWLNAVRRASRNAN